MPLQRMPPSHGLADYLVASSEISKLGLVLLVNRQAQRKRSSSSDIQPAMLLLTHLRWMPVL